MQIFAKRWRVILAACVVVVTTAYATTRHYETLHNTILATLTTITGTLTDSSTATHTGAHTFSGADTFEEAGIDSITNLPAWTYAGIQYFSATLDTVACAGLVDTTNSLVILTPYRAAEASYYVSEIWADSFSVYCDGDATFIWQALKH